MPVQAYRYSAEITGVWFLEESKLRELDEKFETHFAALKRMRQGDVNEAARHERKRLQDLSLDEEEIKSRIAEFKKEEKKRPPHANESCTISIGVAFKELATCSSFAEAISGKDLVDARPTEFKAILQAGKNTTEVSLIEGIAGNKFEVRVQPDGPATAAFLAEIERWAETHREERFMQWWHRQWVLWMYAVWVVFTISLNIFDAKQTSHDDLKTARAEARTLVDQGIAESNRDQALSVILRLLSDTGPTVKRLYSGWWTLGAMIALFTVMPVVAMPPRSILGIGRGKNQLYWRKQWFWFWTRFIPVTVVGGISLKIIIHVIAGSLMSK